MVKLALTSIFIILQSLSILDVYIFNQYLATGFPAWISQRQASAKP